MPLFAFVFLPEPLITPPHLDRLSNLKSLAMDFCDFTSDLCHLLASPRRTPLHRLSLVLNGSALGKKSLDRTPSDNDWKSMVNTLFLHLFFFFMEATILIKQHHLSSCLLCSSSWSGPCERQPASVHHGPGGGECGSHQDPKAQPAPGATPPGQLQRAGVGRGAGARHSAVQQDTDSPPSHQGRSCLSRLH